MHHIFEMEAKALYLERIRANELRAHRAMNGGVVQRPLRRVKAIAQKLAR